MRTIGVVLLHPLVQRRLSLPDALERTAVVEEFTPQRLMEPLDLARRGRRRRLGQPVRDPVLPADPVEQHLTTTAEPGGELLAVVGQHLFRYPEHLQGPGKGRADRPSGRPLDHRRDHAVPGMVIHSGHDLRLGQLAGDRVDQHHPADDVHLPQLHRTLALPALVIRPFTPPDPRLDQPMADEDPIHGHPRRHRRHRPGPLQHMSDPPRTPPRMLTPQLTDSRLHLGRRLMRTRRRPTRTICQPGQTRSLIPGLPPADRLPGHTQLSGDLGHGRTRQDSQDSPVSLLDNRQLHQRQSRPPATRRNDVHRKADHGHCQPSAGIELSSITRDRTNAAQGELFRVSLLDQGGPLARPARARPCGAAARSSLRPARRRPRRSGRATTRTANLFRGSAPDPGPLSEGVEGEWTGAASSVVWGFAVAGGGPSPPGHRRRTRNPRGPPRPSARVTK